MVTSTRTLSMFPLSQESCSPAVDPMVGTVYTSNGDDTVSIIPVPR
jgi:hypothetical protein